MPRSFLPVLALAAAVSFATPAWAAPAPDWSPALPADAVATWFEGADLRVMVVSAGKGADAAADALNTALRSARSVKVTMPDDALGDVSALDDAAILAKAKVMPVDLVAVTRVFPGDGADNAVVTVYRLDGQVASAFTASSKAPLAARKAGGGGVTGAAAGVVDGVVGGNNADLEARVKQFEDRAIWMQGYAAVDARTGRIVSTWSVPMKGKYGAAFKGPEFYEYVGQPQHAETYRKRNRTRLYIGVGGLAAIAGGGAYMLAASKPDPFFSGACDRHLDEDYFETPAYNSCVEKIQGENAVTTAIGLSFVGLGTVAISVPFFIDPNPIPRNERSRLVDEYNDNLRKELGLEAASGSRLGVSFSAGGWVSQEGGGLTLAGSF